MNEDSSQTSRKEADKDYIPLAEDEHQSSLNSSSYASEPSSSYDPLENMEAYLRMRGQL